MKGKTLLPALVALTCAAPLLQPARAQEDDGFATEVQFAAEAVAVPGKKTVQPDPAQIEAVLAKRLAAIWPKGTRVEAKDRGDIRARIPVIKLPDEIVQGVTRPARLEVRLIDDVQGPKNQKARYRVEWLTVQGRSEMRFRDTRTLRVEQAADFAAKCPVFLDNEDLAPDGAVVHGDGATLAVRVKFNPNAAKRLLKLTKKPGDLLAIMVDGELVAMPLITEKNETGTLDLHGPFASREDAGYLAAALNSGPLPCRLKVVGSKLVAEAEPAKVPGATRLAQVSGNPPAHLSEIFISAGAAISR